MEKIPTAEEFLQQSNVVGMTGLMTPLMTEFAKLHVKAALKEAVKHLPYDDKMNQSLLDERAILNSYPLNKIK
jgi:hypothetical protein